MYTVFPNDLRQMPQDFDSYEEAQAYAEEWLDCEYIIECGG